METEKLQKEKEVTLSDGKKVKVRKPKLRDIRAHFNESNLEQRQVAIVGSLAEMSHEELDNLDYSDFMLIKDTIESFLSIAGRTA